MATRFRVTWLPIFSRSRTASPWGGRHASTRRTRCANWLAAWSRYGFVLPILIDTEGRVVGGWGLVLAARQLGLSEVPAVRLTDLSEAELRMLRLALNRMTEDSAWDRAALCLEFSDLLELEPQLDLEVSGFEIGEIDIHLGDKGIAEEDDLPKIDNPTRPVTQVGDLFLLGDHRLLCGDALKSENHDRVLGTDKAEMTIADPPYNVPVEGHVSGLGAIKHRDFAMASGELSSEEFKSFLATSLGHAASRSIDGAIHYIFMDWRHQREMMAAGDKVDDELKNLSSGTRIKLARVAYRSKHELIFVFKVGKRAAHQQCRARAIWPAPDQCLGLCQPERIERHRKEQACLAPDRQASRHDR